MHGFKDNLFINKFLMNIANNKKVSTESNDILGIKLINMMKP